MTKKKATRIYFYNRFCTIAGSTSAKKSFVLMNAIFLHLWKKKLSQSVKFTRNSKPGARSTVIIKSKGYPILPRMYWTHFQVDCLNKIVINYKGN